MKYCVIFGSPRKDGNTAQLLKPFMEELKREGHEVIFYDVYESKIDGCRVCLACQKDKTTFNCVIDDEMQPILKTVSESDYIVVAAPVYIWSAPAPVKVVLERVVYAGCKYYGDDPHGPSLFKGKKLAVLTTCGYPVDVAAPLYEDQMKLYCKHIQMEYAGMLCERQRNLKESFMDEVKYQHAVEFAKGLK